MTEAIKHAQALRRFLLRKGCEVAQSPEERSIFEAILFLENLQLPPKPCCQAEDAARYRWLRDSPVEEVDEVLLDKEPEEWDAAIDTARRRSPAAEAAVCQHYFKECPTCVETTEDFDRQRVQSTSLAAGHYPVEFGPSDARRFECSCGNADPSHADAAGEELEPAPSVWANCSRFVPDSTGHYCHECGEHPRAHRNYQEPLK